MQAMLTGADAVAWKTVMFVREGVRRGKGKRRAKEGRREDTGDGILANVKKYRRL